MKIIARAFTLFAVKTCTSVCRVIELYSDDEVITFMLRVVQNMMTKHGEMTLEE